MKKGAANIRPWYETYFGYDYLKIDVQNNTDAEVDFIWEALALKRGTKLLDVACGYGRHLEPLVKRGATVTGCDFSSVMLGEASKRLGNRKKDSHLVRCDIRSMPFARSFDAACFMFNSFGYFENEKDNFRALTSIAQTLKKGGVFLLDLTNRDFYLRSFIEKDCIEYKNSAILEKKWFDPIRNRSEIDVTVIDNAGIRKYHHSIRLYSYSELVMLLEASGFRVQAVYGGFKGENFDWNHDRMLILCKLQDMEEVCG